ILAVNIANPCAADRAIEWNTGQRQRGGSAEHGGDIRINFWIGGHHGGDDLDFVIEAFRKQRPDRTVNEPRSQGFLLAGSAFALEKTTGNRDRQSVVSG